MNIRAKISEERRINAYHDRISKMKSKKALEKVLVETLNNTKNFLIETLENKNVLKNSQIQEREIIEFTGNKEALEKSGLDEFDLGRPTCPDIIINKIEVGIQPRAWEVNGKWYYNWKGAIKEAEFQGKKIPSKEDWKRISEMYLNDGNRMSRELGLSSTGFHSWFDGGYVIYKESNVYYWSSSNLGDYFAYSLSFNSNNIYPMDINNIAYGFNVRCLKN